MYGYTSHIPRLQELCDWLNSIPNSWSGTYNYYHYNSNYTPSSANKLLQVNSSGSAEFTPTGVYYINTETNKFIKEEEIRVYRFVWGVQSYDYGTVSGLTLNHNAGTYYGSGSCNGWDESIGSAIIIDYITMNDSSRTPNYATLSDFETSNSISLSISNNRVYPKIYVPSTLCYNEDRSGYVKHKPTNTIINYTWRLGKSEKSITIHPIFTTRKSGINIVRFRAKIWLSGFDDISNSNSWDTIDWTASGTYPNHYRGSYIDSTSTSLHSCGYSYIGWPDQTVYMYISAIAIDSSGGVYDVGCYGNPLWNANASNLDSNGWIQANTGYAISFTIFDPNLGAIMANGEYSCSVDDLYCILNCEDGSIGLLSSYASNIDNVFTDAALDQHAISCGYSGYSLL